MQNTPPIENLLSTQNEIRAKQDELESKEHLGILDDKLEMSETCCFEEYLKDRDEKNFISRVFGIFAEDLIELWIRHSDEYKFYGDKRLRPSLYNKKGLYLKTTLDFVLEEVSTKKIFIVEMKSEMAYKNFQNVSLNEKNLQSKMKNDSFKRFVELAKDPSKYIVKVEDKKIKDFECMLIWNHATESNIDLIRKNYKIKVITLESILNEIDKIALDEYLKNKLDQISSFFEFLKGVNNSV